MSPSDQEYIVLCAQRCERDLALESTYVRVGDYDSAARCADAAEVDSFMAFTRANPAAGWEVGR